MKSYSTQPWVLVSGAWALAGLSGELASGAPNLVFPPWDVATPLRIILVKIGTIFPERSLPQDSGDLRGWAFTT